jgi:hypothetical protein
MIRVVFKNLEESQLAKEAVLDRIEATLDRFPELVNHRMVFTLSMDNSPFKPGPDLFTVKLQINGEKYNDIILEKSAMSLYSALASVAENTLERLNRFGDKQRMKRRRVERQLVHASKD